MLNLGLDLHGVVDAYPNKFCALGKAVKELGGTVTICTGAPTWLAQRQIDALGKGREWYDYIFSITDFLKSQSATGAYIQNSDGGIRVDDELWDSVKAKWAKENKIDLHIDDSPVYGKYFDEGIYLKFNSREKR